MHPPIAIQHHRSPAQNPVTGKRQMPPRASLSSDAHATAPQLHVDEGNSSDGDIKLANACSSAFKDPAQRYSCSLDESWPEKRLLFEYIMRNYQAAPYEGLKFVNNLLSCAARVYFQSFVQGKVQSYQHSMHPLESKFQCETIPARIMAKLDDLNFEEFITPDCSLNISFAKMTARINKHFPRTPHPFQSNYKRRTLHRAVAKPQCARATIYRTLSELVTYVDSVTALAYGFQKHVAWKPETSPATTPEALYINPRYGRPTKSWSHHPRSIRYHSKNQNYTNTIASKELAGLLKQEAYKILRKEYHTRDENIIGCRFSVCIKNAETNFPLYKACFIAQGHMDKEKGSMVHHTTILHQSLIRMIFALAVIVGFNLWSTDSSQTYIQAASNLMHDIYIRPSEELQLALNQPSKLPRPFTVS